MNLKQPPIFPVSVGHFLFPSFSSSLVFIASGRRARHAQDSRQAEQKQINQEEQLSLEKVTLFN